MDLKKDGHAVIAGYGHDIPAGGVFVPCAAAENLRFWPINYLLDDIVGFWDNFYKIWLIQKLLYTLKRSKTKYWTCIIDTILIFQSNVYWKMKKFLKIENPT